MVELDGDLTGMLKVTMMNEMEVNRIFPDGVGDLIGAGTDGVVVQEAMEVAATTMTTRTMPASAAVVVAAGAEIEAVESMMGRRQGLASDHCR